jgi:hypothetical protein
LDAVESQIADHKEHKENRKKKSSNQELIEKMLLQNYNENDDILSLSHSLRANAKITYDIPSLAKSEFVYDVCPDLLDPSVGS